MAVKIFTQRKKISYEIALISNYLHHIKKNKAIDEEDIKALRELINRIERKMKFHQTISSNELTEFEKVNSCNVISNGHQFKNGHCEICGLIQVINND